MTKVTLFTTATCSVCKPIKQKLVEAGISFEEVDAGHPEGREALFSYGARAVPFLHAVNAHGSEYQALGTGINVKSLKEMLDA